MVNISKIIANYKRLKEERTAFQERWQDVKRYVLPEIGEIYDASNKQQGTRKTEYIYDCTANLANNVLATNIHNTLTSPAMPWFKLSLRNRDQTKDRSVKEWLQECSDKLYWAFYYSNFNTAIQQIWLMLPSIGTAVLYFEDKDNTGEFNFRPIQVVNVVCSENDKGIVDRVFWRFKMAARHIMERWGDAIPEIHPVREKAEREPDFKYEIIHFCSPPDSGTKLFNNEHNFVSIYIFEKDGTWLNPKPGGTAAGYYEFPYMVPRYQTVPNEDYGRSPAMIAMGDIKTLNKIIELKLQGVELQILPPFTNENNCVRLPSSENKLQPGKIYYKMPGFNFSRMEVGGDINITELQIERYQQRIKEVFHYDALMLYPDKKYQTAYEVSRHEANILRLLGPAVSKFKKELLDPLIERGFNILTRAGKLPPVPAELEGEPIDIEYIGPLAKAQMLSEVQAIETYLAGLSHIAQFKPGIINAINEYSMARRMAERIGVPLDVIVTEDVFNQRMEREQQMQETLMQAQALNEGGQAFRSAATGLKELTSG